jgi:hypothetical protein
VRDFVGGMNGTPVGFTGADYIMSRFGPALRNTGTNYVEVAHNTRMNLSRISFAIFHARGSSGTRSIVGGKGAGNGPNDTSFWFDYSSSDVPRFFLSQNGTTDQLLTGTSSVNDTRPHLLVGTYDGETQRLYLDGVQEGNTLSWSGNIGTSNLALAFFRLGTLNALHFQGDIFGAFLWSRALSAREIRRLNSDPFRVIRPSRATSYFVPTSPGGRRRAFMVI